LTDMFEGFRRFKAVLSVCLMVVAAFVLSQAAIGQAEGDSPPGPFPGTQMVETLPGMNEAVDAGTWVEITSPLSDTHAFLPLIARDNDPAFVSPYPNCRYGVAIWPDQALYFDIVQNLYAGWYFDFWAHSPLDYVPESEYVPLISVYQDRGGSDVCGPDYGYATNPPLGDGLRDLLLAYPGQLWIVGNEPDRTGQGDTCPQQYAEAYHDVYYFIKEHDPTAQVAIAGLVEVTPGRLQYLDIVWNTYLEEYGRPIPVDVWTMHIYVLSETGDGDANIALGTDPALAIPFSFDCGDPETLCHAEHDDIDLFIEQVVMMREWMKARDQQDSPLLLTEYSLLKPYHYYGTCEDVQICPPEGVEGCFCDENQETFHAERVADFMEESFDFLLAARDPELGYPRDDYRLVQQWNWFSVETDPPAAGHASNLAAAEASYALTIQGQRWRDYISVIPPEVNLELWSVPPVVAVISAGGTATATLSAEVVNNGNTVMGGQASVTFYRDVALAEPVGTATLSELPGCARHAAVVTTTWENLGVGLHPFWVQIDGETDVVQGQVLVPSDQIMLPLLSYDR
jgi:hypothetical protein